MKRRLRKKKRLGEFQELGFPVRFTLSEARSPDECEAFIDEWILGAIEANELQFGGGGSTHAWEGFVTVVERGSATEEHRRALEAWLSSHPSVVRHEVGPLVDAWYGDVDPWFGPQG